MKAIVHAGNFQRINLALAGGGEFCIEVLSRLRFTEAAVTRKLEGKGSAQQITVLRDLFKLRRIFVDHGRHKKRYLRHYPNPWAPQQQMYDAALHFGYPSEHVFWGPYNREVMLAELKAADIKVLILVSYGYAIDKEILDYLESVGGCAIILHPCHALKPGARHIPIRDRGASALENAVATGESYVPLQVAMLRCEPVLDPKDPQAWDTGEIVQVSGVTTGLHFSPEEQGPEMLSARVIKGRTHLTPLYGQPLPAICRLQGITPDQLVHAGVPTQQIVENFGYTFPELAAGFARITKGES